MASSNNPLTSCENSRVSKDFIKQMIEKDPENLFDLDDEILLKHIDLVAYCVNLDIEWVKYIPNEFRNNEHFVGALMSQITSTDDREYYFYRLSDEIQKKYEPTQNLITTYQEKKNNFQEGNNCTKV